MPQSQQPGVPVSAHRLRTEVLQALARTAREGIGEGRGRGRQDSRGGVWRRKDAKRSDKKKGLRGARQV